jgi:hypothetical protein
VKRLYVDECVHLLTLDLDFVLGFFVLGLDAFLFDFDFFADLDFLTDLDMLRYPGYISTSSIPLGIDTLV